MPKVRQKRKAESEWEKHRSTIEQLYRTNNVQLEGDHGVINLMISRHNFHATYVMLLSTYCISLI
jgi:hypothetical protein